MHVIKPGILCETCALLKSKEEPHTGKIARGTHKLEVISIDICGPFRDLGSNGEKYWLTIVDNYTSRTWAFPMRSRDSADLVRILRDFLEAWSRPESRCHHIHLDQSGENVSTEMQLLCQERGISLCFTSTD